MHVLSSKENSQLLSLLFEGDKKSFSSLSKAFCELFGGPLLFNACCSLLLLLEDPALLKPPQRLTAWFLVATSWGHAAGGTNPFGPFLIKAACNVSGKPHERNLLLEVFYYIQQEQRQEQQRRQQRQDGTAAALGSSSSSGDASGSGAVGGSDMPVGKLSPLEYLETCQLLLVRTAGPAELAAVEQQLVGLLGLRPPAPLAPTCFISASLLPCVPDDATAHAGNSPAPTTATNVERPGISNALGAAGAADAPARRAAAAGLLDAAGPSSSCPASVPRGFEPGWVRPAPAVMAPQPEEYKWLEVDLHGDLVWDSTMCEDTSRLATVRDLVGRALRGPLLPSQQQQVLSELDAEPPLVHRTGLTPRRLPALVEHCPVLAFELLLRLIKSPSIGEYLSVLAGTEMSLHSMEVVNRLTTSVSLPTEFIHLYIANCISSCESTQDKYVQNRLVRLVCVFLQSLIRNKIINIADLLHEVQAFCINFSRIREAAKLFRLLKQIEAGGAVRPGDSSPSQSHAGDLFVLHSFVDDCAEEPLAGSSGAQHTITTTSTSSTTTATS